MPTSAALGSPLALSEEEQSKRMHALCSERYADTATEKAQATLPDEDTCLGSVSTMNRLLAANTSSAQQSPRPMPSLNCRPQHPSRSWDITKLKRSAKWAGFHLLVILDIFGRYITG